MRAGCKTSRLLSSPPPLINHVVRTRDSRFRLKCERIPRLRQDLSTIQPYYTLVDALEVAAKEGRLRCERTSGRAWLCFETLAQLQAASSFRSASDQHTSASAEYTDIPIGEVVDGVVEVAENTPAPEQLQRVVTMKPTTAAGLSAAERPAGRQKRPRAV